MSVLGLFLFLTTPATAEEATPIRDGGQGRATSLYFETTRRVLRAYDGDHESDQLRHALAKDAVELLKAHADRGRSIEDQPVLTRLQEALQRSVAGLPLADRMKADIAAIHLADRDGDSEDVVLFGLEVLRFSPVIAIHRIASTYDVLPASVPLGRGVFVDGIRALDVTGDGIKEAVVWDDRMPPLIWNWGPGRGVRSMAILTHARATATSPYLAVKGANAKDATSAALAPSFTRANGVTVRPDYVAPQERGAQPTAGWFILFHVLPPLVGGCKGAQRLRGAPLQGSRPGRDVDAGRVG